MVLSHYFLRSSFGLKFDSGAPSKVGYQDSVYTVKVHSRLGDVKACQ